MGDVNTWLIDCAYIQIGKRLNLPTHTYMGSADSKVIDAQAGGESMGGTLLAALAGANMISGAGMLDFLRCQSFEKLVIDAEFIGMAKRLVTGIEKRDQPIALDLMRQAGHKANFLSMPHTQRTFRKELYIPTPVMDRGSWDAWQKKGALSSQDRASARIESLLNSYIPNSLDEVLRAELRQIVQQAAQKHGMDRLPPLES
jgi:trimethylamine--corrinoid protein Co-methyltransferase